MQWAKTAQYIINCLPHLICYHFSIAFDEICPLWKTEKFCIWIFFYVGSLNWKPQMDVTYPTFYPNCVHAKWEEIAINLFKIYAGNRNHRTFWTGAVRTPIAKWNVQIISSKSSAFMTTSSRIITVHYHINNCESCLGTRSRVPALRAGTQSTEGLKGSTTEWLNPQDPWSSFSLISRPEFCWTYLVQRAQSFLLAAIAFQRQRTFSSLNVVLSRHRSQTHYQKIGTLLKQTFNQLCERQECPF